MPTPGTHPIFYASKIIVKAVTDKDGELFELDIGVAASWCSTKALPRVQIEAIRAAAAHPVRPDGTEFVAILLRDGSAISYCVDARTTIRDEWSFV